jgi:hypothetical protein
MYRSLTFYTNKKVVRVVGYSSARDSEKVQSDLYLLCLSQFFKISIIFLIIPYSMNYKE